MEISIFDLINLKKLEGIKLIAGKKGLNRIVTSCGILDYELDSFLKDKYLYQNFKENQFILTTFLYAKDDEHLIGEAVKYLIDKNVSCLVIKNIYNLRIHDYVIRYADSKDFPILIMESHNLYFEEIIVSIDECIKNRKNLLYGQEEFYSIMNKPLDKKSIKACVYEINPSLLNHYITIYFYFKEEINSKLFDILTNKYRNSKFFTPLISLIRYCNGLMMIYSSDYINLDQVNTIVNEIFESISNPEYHLFIGVSDIHHNLSEMKQAFYESIYASMINKDLGSINTFYKDIGFYKAVFPLSNENPMIDFSKSILKPIQDYDAVNKLNLLETLIQFIKCSGSLGELSKTLSLHENTIRNRMEKIEAITGLNFRNFEHYEQLSLAVKVHICNYLLDEFY